MYLFTYRTENLVWWPTELGIKEQAQPFVGYGATSQILAMKLGFGGFWN